MAYDPIEEIRPLPEDDPFKRMTARDGFHVVAIGPGAPSLHVLAYGDGHLATMLDADGVAVGSNNVVASWEADDPVSRGACQRLALFLSAAARYLNTAGSWDEALAALARMRLIANAGLAFPGYTLLTSEPGEAGDGTYEHVFVAGDRHGAVYWAEPHYTDAGGVIGGALVATTMPRLYGEFGEVEEDHGPSADPTLRRLPARPGDGAA